MTSSREVPKPQPCDRCSHPTRTFWLAEDGALLPWCAFCIATQVMAHIGPVRCQNFATAFADAIASEDLEDLRSVSLALRGLASMLREGGGELR